MWSECNLCFSVGTEHIDFSYAKLKPKHIKISQFDRNSCSINSKMFASD